MQLAKVLMSVVFSLLLGSLFVCPPAFADQSVVSYLLTDSASSTNLCEKVIKASDLGLPGSWSIEKRVLQGGRQDGVDIIVVNNGRLTFTIVPTRGMSIWDVRCKETRVGWDAPVTEIVHPKYVNLLLDDGAGWRHGWGAWLPRCGLRWFGAPGKDEVTGEFITLHGLVDYLPASRVEVMVDTKPPYALTVKGCVFEARLYRPTLELVSEFSTEPDSLQFTIKDQIVNRGGVDAECGMLYHANYGHPLLAKGSRLAAPFGRITPQAKGGFPESAPEEIVTFREPRAGYKRQVWFIKLNGDENGITKLLLRNKEGNLGVSYAYSLSQLPFLTLWKNLVALEDGYVTGIEPGTAYPNHRNIERKNGHYPPLKPGESQDLRITFEVAIGADRVSQIEQEIQAIQGSKKTVYDKDWVEGISY
ncbi:MAG: DUF4432 family protein [bacterium]